MTKAIFSPVTTHEITDSLVISAITPEKFKVTHFNKLQDEIHAFFGAALCNLNWDDYTYHVSGTTYNDILEEVSRLLLNDKAMNDYITVEHDEISGDYFTELVYAQQISEEGEHNYITIRIENMDMIYGEEMMERTINQARSIHERLSFPM